MTLALYGKSKRRQGSLLLLGVFAVFVALLAGLTLRQDSANALTLGSTNGTWTAVTGSPPALSGLNTDRIYWGENTGSGQSSYRWTAIGAPTVFSAGDSFLLGRFRHYNEPITGGSISSATLSLPLAFTDPVQNVNLSVVFNHHETPNSANPCAYPAADNSNGCADRVQLPSLADQVFQVGDNLYILEFTGFKPLISGSACPTDINDTSLGAGTVDTFYTKEDATNTACIYAKLTFTAPVVDVEKAAVIGTVNQGEDAAFKITVKNSSSPSATGWSLSDQLPAGFAWSIDPAVTDCSIDANQLLTCTNLTIPAGTPQSPGKLDIVVKASTTGAKCEPIVNQKATISKSDKPSQDSSPATVNVVGCPVVHDPTISKEKVNEGLTETTVLWDISVNNTASGIDQTVEIHDSGVEWVSTSGASTGSCADTDFSDGKIVCTVKAGQTLTVQVKKARPAAQCTDQTINNSAMLYLVVPGAAPKQLNSDGGDGSTEYTIPGDPGACDKPGISKTTTTTSTTDPSAVKWTVTVTNPASGTGTTQTVYIKDSNVNVVGSPTFGGGASCTTTNFEADLNGSGVQCSMPNASTISFDVKPAGTIARTCEDQRFNNTAYLYIGSTANTAMPAQGAEITLQGNPDLCTRNLTICKVVEGNGDLAVRSGEFKFDYYPQGGSTLNVGVNASEPNPDQTPGTAGTKVCTTQPIPMPTDKQLTVSEWTSVRPAGWDSSANDAAGYPKVQLGDGTVSSNVSINIPAGTSDVTVTFYNREKLPAKNVTFQKYICDSLGDVARNEAEGGVDQVGMPSMSANGGLSGQLNQTEGPAGGGTAVNPSNDGRGNCHLWGSDLAKYPEETGTWDIQIYDTSRSNLLQTVNIPQGGTTSVQLLDSALLETLKASSNGARVEEVFKTGYGFGSLKCYTDHKNQDNWEWLDFNPGGIPTGDVYCIAYNVPADKEIVIEKQFVELNGTVPTSADVPGFTLNPSANTSCAAPVKVTDTTWTVTCTVPYDWNGKVTETLPLPAGWEETECAVGAQTTPQNLRFTFCNRPVGTVVIVKYENVPPATTQNWTFNGTLPGAPVGLSTTGTTEATGSASTTITNVPAGSYTLAELQGQGVCESGDTSSDYQTRGLTSSTLPSATDVNGAPIIGAGNLSVTVGKGTTTYVAFGNQGCGTVLSAANLQVFKYSDPAANFTGTTELADWTITITGTAGAATGFSASEDTVAGTGAFFLGIPDGTYTVCETAKAGWAVVGSKYNATNQPGVCRTGVVVNLDQTVVVNFYNQPRVNIEVNKTEISLATPAGAPGKDWSFTLTGCGITPVSATTGTDGKATFSNLPPAVGCSYTVTETVKSGWSAINPVQVTAPATAGQTAVLSFTNIKIEVCTNCVTIVTPTPTPTTPTVTPEPSETPETPGPSETPETPSVTPETTTPGPTEDTAGARTPGPGQTPIAPSTGNGFMGSGPGGVNMLLALVGLLALSLGTTILALGRKSSRR